MVLAISLLSDVVMLAYSILRWYSADILFCWLFILIGRPIVIFVGKLTSGTIYLSMQKSIILNRIWQILSKISMSYSSIY